MINKVILVGHLGKDPELHRAADGRALATFSLATSEHWRDKSTGEKRQRTEWHSVVIFVEPLVKVAEQYLKKGARVYLEGKNQSRRYTDNAGVERVVTEVVLSGFGCALVLCDRAGPGRAPAPDDGEPTGEGPQPAAAAAPSVNDEVPF